MKRILFILFSFGLSTGAFANILFDGQKCNLDSSRPLGGCFQNNTHSNIGGKALYLEEQNYFKNGSSSITVATLSHFDDNRYISIIDSPARLKAKNIAKIIYTIAFEGKKLSGCQLTVDAQSIEQHPVIKIRKTKNKYFC